jgi:hypothetical protein
MLPLVFAEHEIQVYSSFDSFGGLVIGSPNIYEGSSITYNLILTNIGQALPDTEFSVAITDPDKNVIENRTFIKSIPENNNISLNSSIENDLWSLIYAPSSGLYTLTLTSSNPEIKFLENTTFGFRHDHTMPFFFEVKPLSEYRQSELNKKSEKANNEMLILTERMVKVGEKEAVYAGWSLFAAFAMLFVALITLFAVPESRNLTIKIIRIILMILGIIFLILGPLLVTFSLVALD